MRFAMRGNAGVFQQRSFWLRCFLSVAFSIVLLCSARGGVLQAQIAVEKPIHLSHVEGYIVNASGKPVANAEVTLVRDERVLMSTRTDQAGAFRFDHASGKYWLHVARTDSAPAGREIVVTEEIVTHLQRKRLYVVLGPGACMDECSSVSTSRHEFENAVRRNTEHHD